MKIERVLALKEQIPINEKLPLKISISFLYIIHLSIRMFRLIIFDGDERHVTLQMPPAHMAIFLKFNRYKRNYIYDIVKC